MPAFEDMLDWKIRARRPMRRNPPLRIAYAAALTLVAFATTASPSAANDLYNARLCANMRDSIAFYIF